MYKILKPLFIATIPMALLSERLWAEPSDILMDSAVSCYSGASAYGQVFAATAEDVMFFRSLVNSVEPVVLLLPKYAKITEREWEIVLDAGVETLVEGLNAARQNGQTSTESIERMRTQVEAVCDKAGSLRASEGF